MNVPQAIINIAEICAQHQLHQVVLSPGSRNAPLTLSFSRHSDLEITVIADERSAGYVALGMAQQLNKPVVLVCTSGTAVLNYGPAIAEAFYQQVPLLVLTADRPPEWIDQQDGQTIRQSNLFDTHVKASYTLPVDTNHPHAHWELEWKINQAILKCQEQMPGPVHVNVPLREPLYPATGDPWEYKLHHPITIRQQPERQLDKDQWNHIITSIRSSSRPLIVGGQQPYQPQLVMTLRDLCNYSQIPLIGDAISNLQGIDNLIKHIEVITLQDTEVMSQLQPDLLISYGNGVISKNLKLFLRKFPPEHHFHVQPTGIPANTFQSLTEVVSMEPLNFFTRLARSITAPVSQSWYDLWQQQEAQAKNFILTQAQELDLHEMWAVQKVLEMLPECKLHLANSMPVRWVDLLGVNPKIREVCANRGTSGIDGCNSTAVGHALKDPQTQVLLLGDMAFFYDRNAFWHQYALPNLKVIILNNQGGGIFRLIDGPSSQPECEKYFVTPQSLHAENTARDFGFKYLYCDDMDQLEHALSQLFEKHETATILEISVPQDAGAKFKELKERIRNSYERD